MNRNKIIYSVAGLVLLFSGASMACEYVPGTTLFADYADCRYGPDNVEVVSLPESSSWDSCVYYVEPFRPGKLLAITRTKNGSEEVSINNRSSIGNPCYMTKAQCDAALKVAMGQ